MIRPLLQHIELPLMNHFMCQGIEQFLFRIGCPRRELFEQRERQANFPMTVRLGEGIKAFGPSATGKHADRGREALTPKISIGLRELAKYRAFKCCQWAWSPSVERGIEWQGAVDVDVIPIPPTQPLQATGA